MKKFYITPIFLFLLFSCNYYSNKINHLQSDEYIDSIYESFDSLDKMKLKQINDSINILRIQMVLVHEKKSIENSNANKHLLNSEYFQLKEKLMLFEEQREQREQKRLQSINRPNFPVNDIIICIDDTLYRKEFENHHDCIKCNQKSEFLKWIYFKSPESTWKQLCGREGPLSICEKCKIPIEFITYKMN